MDLKEIIELSLIELIPTLPVLIYIIVTQNRNYKRLLKVESKVEIAALQSGIGAAWAGSEKPPFIETITAIFNNLNLGANGNHIDRAVEVIMLIGKDQGVKLFHSVLSAYRKNNEVTPYFEECIKEIGVRIK